MEILNIQSKQAAANKLNPQPNEIVSAAEINAVVLKINELVTALTPVVEKLATVAENANNYQHPNQHSLTIITETETLKVMTADERQSIIELTAALGDISAILATI